MTSRKVNVSLSSSSNPKLKLFLRIQSGDFIEKSDFKIEKDSIFSYPVYGGNGLIGFTNKYNVLPNTIVVGRVGALCGNVHFITEKAWITDNSLFLNILLRNKLEYKFLYYLLKSFNLNQYSRSTAQPLITSKTIKDRTVMLPSIMNQESISWFISNKTTEIDDLIMDKEKLIKLLEEKRQAVITEAVTKGLDPNVKMKDSGVEWIGEIPEHWEVSSINLHFTESKTKNIGNREINVLSLSYGKIKRRDVESNFGLLPASFETYRTVKNGDIVLRLTDLQNDKKSLRVGLVKENGIITSAYLTLIPNKNISSEYGSSLLHVYDLLKVFYGLGSGVRQSLGYQDFKKLPILLPSKKEQVSICDYSDNFMRNSDEILEGLKVQNNKLKEYRQSLIYEAVTGKIDVREMMDEIEQEEVSSS